MTAPTVRWAVLPMALAAVPATVHAQPLDPPYHALDFRMLNTSNDPFPYYVDGRMKHPGTVLIGQIQSAADQAFKSWEDIACAYPAFQSLGLSTNNPQILDPGDPYDVFNVVAYWVTDAADPYYGLALGAGAASMASIPLSWAGTLYQCDIYINAVDYKWSTLTPTPQDALDLQTLLAHEVGHCMGLGHSEWPDDVMWGSIGYGQQRRAPSARDQQMACQLFPQSGAVGSPCTDEASCGGSLECIAPPLPDGGAGGRICSKGCEPGVPGGCVDPFVCKPSTVISGSNGACLPSGGDAVTQVGAPCQNASQCGSPVGLCQPEAQLPSGFPAWQGGYCTQNCATGQVPCPAGAACIDFGNGELRCLKTCRLGSGDCRAGYTCIRLNQDVNICSPSCHANADCAPGYTCRLCDGTCVANQNPSGQVGDLCPTGDECGPGQVCLLLDDGFDTRICSQTCSTAACSCPPGTTCHTLANGDRYCLRDCAGGKCPPGLQCGLLPSGQACIGPCSTHEDCPVGSYCLQGQCTNPQADAGTCALCPWTNDAGTNPSIHPRPDAGTGGASSGGCGCRASPGALALMWPLGVALWVIAARRGRMGPS